MFVLSVKVVVKEQLLSDFISATTDYVMIVHQEKGNIRYDLLQDEEAPNTFIIYEAYQDKEAFLFHRDTTHSLKWKSDIEHMMQEPRTRNRCNSIIFS